MLKKSKYIAKRLVTRIEKMNTGKAPISKILEVLKIKALHPFGMI